jgi:prephenate dehydratase
MSGQTTTTIGLAGARGSFSEEAANYYAGKEHIADYRLDYLVTAEDLLSAVEKGTIDYGIFPIENSNGGIVYEAVYAMAKHCFTIVKFFEIDVHHCLLVYPGAKADDIQVITSHDQALKQCRMYLKRRWPNVLLKEYMDTAKAAEDLGTGVFAPHTAVVAPRVCAALYGLELLEESIQDLKFNFTTFLAVTK